MINFRELTRRAQQLYLEDNQHAGDILYGMFLTQWLESLGSLFRGLGEWQELPLPEGDPQNILFSALVALQTVGMTQGSGGQDDPVWEVCTSMLESVRRALKEAYGVDLPKMRVVSMVTQAVEAGHLKSATGPDGEEHISLPD